MDKEVVVLVGAQGAGKSTYCQEQLGQHVRISQDDHGRVGHVRLFVEALERGERLVVVDRINGVKSQRKRYLELARQHGYRTRIVWLNVDRAVCLKRCRDRGEHPTLLPNDADRALALYFSTFQTPSRREADVLTILGPAPVFVPVHDVCAQIGERRHIIVGDVHGCFDELRSLLDSLHFEPENDVLISVGDLVDRGPQVREVFDFVRRLPAFYMVLGNHEEKFLRYLQGRDVKIAHGLDTTIASYADGFPEGLMEWLAAMPLILKTPSGHVVHAGFDPELSPDEQRESDCIYMRYYGGKTYFDAINGRPWYDLWPSEGPRVFFGHIPLAQGPCAAHVVSLDGGCVFGGALKAFDSRDGRVHAVPAQRVHSASDFARGQPATPVEALERREEYVASGMLRTDRTDDGRLAIYTYTDGCVFESAWDDITRNARGHIYDLSTGECVAYPFPKFFNLGENLECQAENYPWDEPFEVYEKMDGWLGVLYRHEGRCKVASRGSFHSTGAVWATSFLEGRDFSCLPDEATLCFEILHPEHRIILNYEHDATLVVLAAFDRHTGREYPRGEVARWAESLGLPIVPLIPAMTLDDLLSTQKNREKFEGYVLRFSDGRRVKVKTDWYLQMAKIMSNLSPIAVWDVMVEGKVRTEYLVQVPEELRPLAERYQTTLEDRYARTREEILRVLGPLIAQFGNDRRGLGLYIRDHHEELGELKRVVFALMDERWDKIDRVIMDMIYPKGNQLD